ncbi:hypothetical protein CHS0354_027222 [Potamilus streckersoni]|uniref:Cyclic nucleotide-binding domain-containing protein n=1 Tax=Potamilus streckersoni TaxID=2493646 RepID=A0AAE0SYW6_9BIVA|nr:hypothetical protein CHS0354_027222 [Potamilus streckersoni]
MANIIDELIRVITRPSFKRTEADIEAVLPWLRKQSQLLHDLDDNVVIDIVQHCAFLRVKEDELIIKQGDKGDCFYIVLKGSVSIYIDPKLTGEMDDGSLSAQKPSKEVPKKKQKIKDKSNSKEDEERTRDEDSKEHQDDADVEEGEKKQVQTEEEKKKLVPLDRSKYGKLIMKYDQGKAFGELALVHRDSIRNATIISDEDVDLMVIGQDLFDRALRVEQERKYAEIREFIDAHPFFCHMTQKIKKLLEMSLRKETFIFDTNIVQQGELVTGLRFIIRGGAKIIVEPKKHQKQYQNLWPFEAGVDIISMEFEHLRDLRRAAILRKYEDPAVWETKSEDLVIRRTEGYAAIEKRMQEKTINLCTVQGGEVIGDTELLVGLTTHMQTVRCTANTEVFVLDTKNFERLIGKKNPTTLDVMREYVKSKMKTRMEMKNGDLIPFLQYLHCKLTEQSLPPPRKVEPFKMSKTIPDEDTEMQHLIRDFKEGKSVLIKPKVPGLVYYKEMMHEKIKLRESMRKANNTGDGIKVHSVYKTKPKKKPRSILEIRASLRQMMEVEFKAIETKKLRKKLTEKKFPLPRVTSAQTEPVHYNSTESIPGVLKQHSKLKSKSMDNLSKVLPFMPSEPKEESQPLLLSLIKKSRGRKKEDKENIPPPSADVLDLLDKKKHKLPSITKVVVGVPVDPQPHNDLTLAVIKEEKTQEEIIIRYEQQEQQKQHLHPSKLERHKSDTGFKDDNCRNDDSADVPVITALQKLTLPKLNQTDLTATFPAPARNEKSNSIDVEKTELMDESLKTIPKSVIHQVFNLTDEQVKGDQHEKNESGTSKTKTALTDQEVKDERHENKQSGPSKWKAAMKFVNEKIQKRLQEHEDNRLSEIDFEAGNPTLRLLENRIQAFHVKYGAGSLTRNLPPLRRYKLQEEDMNKFPKPGGKVWIKKRSCRFAHSEYIVKDHKHTHYYMVESLPEFKKVEKSRAIVSKFLEQVPSVRSANF